MISLLFAAFVLAVSTAPPNLFAGHDHTKFIFEIYADYSNFHYGFDYANSLALKYIDGQKVPQDSYYITDSTVYPPFQAAFQSVLITPYNTTVPIYFIERRERYVYVFGFPLGPRSNDVPLLLRLKAHYLVNNTQTGYYFGNITDKINPYDFDHEVVQEMKPVYETVIYRAMYWDAETTFAELISAIILNKDSTASLLGFPMFLENGDKNEVYKFKINSGRDETKPSFNPFLVAEAFRKNNYLTGKLAYLDPTSLQQENNQEVSEHKERSKNTSVENSSSKLTQPADKEQFKKEQLEPTLINFYDLLAEKVRVVPEVKNLTFVPNINKCYVPGTSPEVSRICAKISQVLLSNLSFIKTVQKFYFDIDPDFKKCLLYDSIMQSIRNQKEILRDLEFQGSSADVEQKRSVLHNIKHLENDRKSLVNEVNQIIKRIRKYSDRSLIDLEKRFSQLEDEILPSLEEFVQITEQHSNKDASTEIVKAVVHLYNHQMLLFTLSKFYLIVLDHKNGIPDFSKVFSYFIAENGQERFNMHVKLPYTLLQVARSMVQKKYAKQIDGFDDLALKITRGQENLMETLAHKLGYPNKDQYYRSNEEFCKFRFFFKDKVNLCIVTGILVFKILNVTANLSKDFLNLVNMAKILVATPIDSPDGDVLYRSIKQKSENIYKDKENWLQQCLYLKEYDYIFNAVQRTDTSDMPFDYSSIGAKYGSIINSCEKFKTFLDDFRNADNFKDFATKFDRTNNISGESKRI